MSVLLETKNGWWLLIVPFEDFDHPKNDTLRFPLDVALIASLLGRKISGQAVPFFAGLVDPKYRVKNVAIIAAWPTAGRRCLGKQVLNQAPSGV